MRVSSETSGREKRLQVVDGRDVSGKLVAGRGPVCMIARRSSCRGIMNSVNCRNLEHALIHAERLFQRCGWRREGPLGNRTSPSHSDRTSRQKRISSRLLTAASISPSHTNSRRITGWLPNKPSYQQPSYKQPNSTQTLFHQHRVWRRAMYYPEPKDKSVAVLLPCFLAAGPGSHHKRTLNLAMLAADLTVFTSYGRVHLLLTTSGLDWPDHRCSDEQISFIEYPNS